MGFLDDVQTTFDKGVTAAKGAVSTVAGEHLGFIKDFCLMCDDGWQAGYHERNGGNASYRLTASEVESVRPFFYTTPSSWVDLGLAIPQMAHEFVLVTKSGAYLRKVKSAPVDNIGIVELNREGSAWRLVWGLKEGGRPTSELTAHIAAHGVRKRVTNNMSRVLYHAHPTNVIALTSLVKADARALTRLLWSMHTESVIAFPEGIGVVDICVPGSLELAHTTAEQLSSYAACIWAFHGIFASGDNFDAAFGLVNTVDKAAGIYLLARAAQGGDPSLPQRLSDECIRATAQAYDLKVNEAFLKP